MENKAEKLDYLLTYLKELRELASVHPGESISQSIEKTIIEIELQLF